jgi:transposase
MHFNTIGVDLAKNVFQVHGVDSAGKVVITRQLRRKQVLDFFSKLPGCLVVWKPAEPVIIGHVKSPSSVTPFV